MLGKIKLIIAGLIVVATSGVVSYVVSASVPDSLVAAGATRYAMVSSSTQRSTSSMSYENLPGMSTSIGIPAGKVGDIMIQFCGGALAGTQMFIRALIGGVTATPTNVLLIGQTTEALQQSQCAIFYMTTVKAGTRTVNMQWRSAFGAPQNIFQDTMIVTVNIH